eukprot:960433-Pyramimonas_sp.AAC.3
MPVESTPHSRTSHASLTPRRSSVPTPPPKPPKAQPNCCTAASASEPPAPRALHMFSTPLWTMSPEWTMSPP